MTDIPPRPLPDPDSAGFWRSASAGHLALQHCARCGRYQFPSLETCRHCRGALTWQPVSGNGTIFSYIVQHHAAAPGFERPYAIALVSPDEAPDLRIPGRLLGDPHGPRIHGPRIGDRVRTEIVPVPGSGFTVPVFRWDDPNPKTRKASDHD